MRLQRFFCRRIYFIRKKTTGYAGGREEFYLWIEKENLR